VVADSAANTRRGARGEATAEDMGNTAEAKDSRVAAACRASADRHLGAVLEPRGPGLPTAALALATPLLVSIPLLRPAMAAWVRDRLMGAPQDQVRPAEPQATPPLPMASGIPSRAHTRML
jgi:hypothetical protein